MEFFIGIFFVIWLALFVSIIGRNIAEWSKNNASPRLTVDALVVTKRNATHHHHHKNHTSHSHSYYVTFEVESGDRMELKMTGREYGMLAEGDFGVLTFQGTRYLGFERKMGGSFSSRA